MSICTRAGAAPVVFVYASLQFASTQCFESAPLPIPPVTPNPTHLYHTCKPLCTCLERRRQAHAQGAEEGGEEEAGVEFEPVGVGMLPAERRLERVQQLLAQAAAGARHDRKGEGGRGRGPCSLLACSLLLLLLPPLAGRVAGWAVKHEAASVCMGVGIWLSIESDFDLPRTHTRCRLPTATGSVDVDSRWFKQGGG